VLCRAVAVAVAVLLLSRSNIPFVPDRVVVLSRFAVLVLSRSLSTRPPTYKEKTAE
jgi:hypothetical protein